MTSRAPNLVYEVDPTIGWVDCPAEILLIIFENLDVTSLRCCSLVNRRWKELVYDICETKELWKDLAEDGIVNYAVTHRSKSTLSWKDLYCNSLLWNNVKSATVSKINEIEKLVIKYIHVYKEKIIVVNSTSVEYYNIESFERIGTISMACETIEENDDMIVVTTKNNAYFRVTLFGKSDDGDNCKNIENHFFGEIYHDACEVSRSWRWRVHGNICYAVDWKSILWKAQRLDNSWHVKSLARYYGVFQCAIENSMSAIHVIKEDVFVSFKFGDLMRVEKNTIEFRRVRRAEVPTFVVTGPKLNKRKPYKKGLDKFNAFLNVPFGAGFGTEFSGRDMLHFYYDDPEMTCGLQHGEVVLLGFDDGRVEITLLKDYGKPAFVLNIKDFDENGLVDPAVTGLEVCEVKNMHMLFVQTNSKLYQLLLRYPDNLVDE